MSKVKIQGNASGTGVLTVTAPNTSTDRTITLPDATGTLATTADSVGGATGVDFNDNVKARFGTGNDLEIYHDATNSLLVNNTGGLRLCGDSVYLRNGANNENGLIFTADGSVDIYHNNVKKFETTSTGATVTGYLNVSQTGNASGLQVATSVAAETTAIFQGGGTGAVDVVDVRDSGGNSKFKVRQNGNVGIGETTPAYTLEIANVSSKGWSVNIENSVAKMRSRASANDTQTHWDIMNGNGVVGTVKSSSSSAQFNTSSDYRLKENVDYTWDATTRLKQLKPARFNFIADDTNTLVDGFIAHEVSSVVPEAISGEKDAMTAEVLYAEGDELPEGKSVGDVKTASVIDPQGIDQSKLVPLLVKAMQEQQEVIESLTARITALEG